MIPLKQPVLSDAWPNFLHDLVPYSFRCHGVHGHTLVPWLQQAFDSTETVTHKSYHLFSLSFKSAHSMSSFPSPTLDSMGLHYHHSGDNRVILNSLALLSLFFVLASQNPNWVNSTLLAANLLWALYAAWQYRHISLTHSLHTARSWCHTFS